MSVPKIRAKARVRVLLEVQSDSVWGPDCTVQQVHEQAIRDIEDWLMNNVDWGTRIRLVGKPTAEGVFTREE